MRVLLFIPVVLSLLVLSAHFLRYGRLGLVIACLLLIALIGVRRPWARRVLQGVLAAAVLIWAQVLAAGIAERQALHQGWHRLAIILGVVVLVSLLSIAALEARSLRAHFDSPLQPRPGPGIS